MFDFASYFEHSNLQSWVIRDAQDIKLVDLDSVLFLFCYSFVHVRVC